MDQVVFIGAHPDDISGSCGTFLRMRGKFGLHLWDFTRGERGLLAEGVSYEECAAMRSAEETKVAAYIGAELEFLGEVNGAAFATREVCERIAEKLSCLQPRAIFTHFIPDTHPDHVMTAAAVLRAVHIAKIRPEIYFVEFSHQSVGFVPDILVDITSVIEEKKELIRLYKCQNVNDIIVQNKLASAKVRGAQIGVPYAEAFARCGFQRDGQKNIFAELD